METGVNYCCEDESISKYIQQIKLLLVHPSIFSKSFPPESEKTSIVVEAVVYQRQLLVSLLCIMYYTSAD